MFCELQEQRANLAYAKQHPEAIVPPEYFQAKYVLLDEFDNGKSNAKVFLVRDHQSKKKLVLKIAGSSRTRTDHEVFTTCAVEKIAESFHRHYFPKLYEAGVTSVLHPWASEPKADGITHPYMVIEFFEGYSPLLKYVAQPRNQLETLGILLQVAHAFSITKLSHRDLHMHNVLYNPDRPNQSHHFCAGSRSYKFTAPPIGIIDFGWASVKGRTQLWKWLREKLYAARVFRKNAPKGFSASDARLFRGEPLDFTYFRVMVKKLLPDRPIPADVHNFSELLDTEYFSDLRK